MKKQFSALMLCISSMCLSIGAYAMPSEALLQTLNAQVLRVHVTHQNGSHGLGSAVVIGQDQAVTNCHVVTDASDVTLMMNGKPLKATAVKPDWYHDLCILTVADLNAPVAKLGASKTLTYETSVLTVGYPDKTSLPVNTFGTVKGLFPMDDSVIIRASSAFKPGASGGGVFDESGSLVGIITLKSRGSHEHYYYMPVEWLQALMQKPAQALGGVAEKPFWAMSAPKRPYFMQVVQPYVAQDWKSLLQVSNSWVKTEPQNAESWFYLAMAEYETQDYVHALEHCKKALQLRQDHALVQDYLHKVSAKMAADNKVFEQTALLKD